MKGINAEDIKCFYEGCIFVRSLEDPIKKAAERAYRDLCRTISFPDGCNKQGLKQDVYDVLKKKISILPEKSQEKYDEWFNSLAKKIIDKYSKSNKDIGFYFGHAQKWINMTMKYLLCLDYNKYHSYEDFLHAPIDKYVVIEAQKDFNITIDGLIPWSRIGKEQKDNEIPALYYKFQEALREHTNSNNLSVIQWEFQAWLNHED